MVLVKTNNYSTRINKTVQNSNWKIDQPDPIYQPDLFELYTRIEQYDNQTNLSSKTKLSII